MSEQKTFTWIHEDECHAFAGEGWRCSQCGAELGPEDRFVVDFGSYCPFCGTLHEEGIMKIAKYLTRHTLDDCRIIASMPIQPIVRCRDCEHFGMFQPNKRYKAAPSCCKFQITLPDSDGFCAWGVRCDG